MSDVIDYYFTLASPFTYLGHKAICDLAILHDKRLVLKPFNIAMVWEHSGSLPLGQRSAIRQRYRLVELQRLAVMRGLALVTQPTNFPTNPALADLCVCALVADGKDARGFIGRVGGALWADDRQIADENVIGELLNQEGHDAKAVIQASKQDAATAMRENNTEHAIASDAIGSPAYVYKGEVFWGQDRIELLGDMIVSGREAFPAA